MEPFKKEDILKIYKSENAGRKALEKYSHLFPIRPSERIAGIIGDIFGDGHMQGNPKWRFDYTSKSIKELKRFEKEIYKEFKIKGKIRECKTNMWGTTYNYGVNSKVISRVLFSFGAPVGNKVLNPLKIPKWILNDKRFFRRFIQRLFDCEGTVDSQGAIELQMWKSQALKDQGFEFFNSIKSHLKEYFDIETTNVFTDKRTNLRKDGIRTMALRMKIRRKGDIEKFFKHINFENNEKKHKLQLLVRRAD